MTKPQIRALIIEDTEDDVQLLVRKLQEHYQLDFIHVDSAPGLRAALKESVWDVVLSDHRMPGLDSFAALEIVKQSGLDLPFIIVSGSIGEDIAVAAIKAGAHDYLVKGRLARLIPAIERELLAAQARSTQFQSEQRFRATFNQAAVGISHVATDGRWLRVNHKLCVITGYSEEELLNRDFQSITHPDDLSADLHGLQRILNGEISSNTAEKRYIRKDGSLVWVNLTISLARTLAGEVDYFIVVTEDVTERKDATEHLRMFARIFDSVHEGIIVTDSDKNIVFVNPAFSAITGYSIAEVLGKTPKLMQSEEMDAAVHEEMWRSINETGRWMGEIVDQRRDGEKFVEWLSVNTLLDESGEASHYIAVFADISERKSVEERMAYMAQHDFLTDLPNRVLLMDRLAQAIAHAERDSRKVAIMFLDLDTFKVINDTLGHQVGDQLLQEVANRIRSTARASDTVSRQGGDEFVIMLPEVENTDVVALIAMKLLDTIAAPYLICENEIDVTTSIGISVYPEDGLDGDTLIKHADAAMYHAKGKGRNNYQFFTAEMNRRALERMAIDRKLRHALERDEFYLHYQPQVDLRSGRIVGAEALLRWDNFETGMIPPGKFIHIAEDNGLIVPIGEWVLREACRQGSEWRERGLPEITMVVNLSVVQFRQRNLGELIKVILRESGLDPSGLELEITEGAVMQDAEAVILLLRKLKDMGVKLAVDDFGTGYSSLSYLKRFPIDKLKIDQSFVRDVTIDLDDAAIVSTIISMAHNLNLKAIAEGVETVEQLDFLRKLECDVMQGYFFSEPLSADDFILLLESGEKPVGTGANLRPGESNATVVYGRAGKNASDR